MTDTAKKPRRREPEGPFSNELVDALLAWTRGEDVEGLPGNSRNNRPSAAGVDTSVLVVGIRFCLSSRSP